MKVVSSESHLLHHASTEVEWGIPRGHFEAPVRAEVIASELRRDPETFVFTSPTEWGRSPIEAVHDPRMVDFIEKVWVEMQAVKKMREVFPDTFLHPGLRESMGPAPEPASIQAQLGYWCFETMTPIGQGTFEAARGAVDIALSAAQFVLNGDRTAFGLCRPPGHHSARAVYGGYCFFNNAAVAAQHIVATTGCKVSVLDVDYHHGNGTQQIFYTRPDVQFVSLHGDPNRAYPYLIGFEDETGSGAGLGTNLNIPLPKETDDAQYLAALNIAVEAIDKFDPGIVIVSLGVDTHERDPISDFAVTTEAYRDHGAAVAALGRPTLVLQEGGYYVPALGKNIRNWLTGLSAN